MFEYKGYIGVARYEPEIEAFLGDVVDTRDVITFEGTSVGELRQSFEDAIDKYLRFCKELGQAHDKPYSGKMLVRTTPDLHRAVSVQASRTGVSLNAWINQALKRALRTDSRSARGRRRAS